MLQCVFLIPRARAGSELSLVCMLSVMVHAECQQADARTATGEGEAVCVATLRS